jgi:hypothetical protein
MRGPASVTALDGHVVDGSAVAIAAKHAQARLGVVLKRQSAVASGARRPWAVIGTVIGCQWSHRSAPCPDRTSRGRQDPAQRGTIHRLAHRVDVTPATQDAQQRPRLTPVDALDPPRNPSGRGTIRAFCRTRLGDGVKYGQPLLRHGTTRIQIRNHPSGGARTALFLTAIRGRRLTSNAGTHAWTGWTCAPLLRPQSWHGPSGARPNPPPPRARRRRRGQGATRPPERERLRRTSPCR